MRAPSIPTPAAVRAINERSTMTRAVDLAWAHPALFVFILALIVRAFIAIVLSRYFSGTLVLDDTTYHQMAAEMASGQTAHWDDFTYQLYWTTAAFTLPVTALYKMFGPTPVVAQLMIGVVGAATALFVTRLAAEFVETRWAILAGLFVALLPSQAFWSSMLMKDAFVWFTLSGLALTVAVAARSTKVKLLQLGVVAALFLIALSYLRLHTLVVASWAVMIAAFFGWKLFRWARVAGALAIGILVPLVFGGIGVAGLGLVTNAGSLEDRRFANAIGANTAIVDTSRPPPTYPTQDSPMVQAIREEASKLTQAAATLEVQAEQIESRAEESDVTPSRRATLAARAERLRARIAQLRAQAAAKLAATERPTPVGDAPLDPDLAHLPRGLSVMLVEPLPVPFNGSLPLRLARLESLLWYPTLVLAAIGLWAARHHLRQLAMPILAGAAIVVMYALTEGNVGTAHRHRGEFVWVVALLAATGVKQLWAKRRLRSTST